MAFVSHGFPSAAPLQEKEKANLASKQAVRSFGRESLSYVSKSKTLLCDISLKSACGEKETGLWNRDSELLWKRTGKQQRATGRETQENGKQTTP